MVVYDGKTVSEGIAIGRIYVYSKSEQSVRCSNVADTAAELARYADAREKAIEELQGLYDKTLREADEDAAKIFQAHQFMVDDDDFIESV